jgi:predicted RNA binding protein YcfA (HicA-like mRNA interferase family)
MTRLSLVDAKDLERLLFSIGFEKTRQKGSHAFYRHPDGRTTTIPHHHGRVISRPLLREILREIEVTVEEYAKLLNS